MKNFFKASYTKLLFYGWEFTTQAKNRHSNSIWPSSIWANHFLYTYENKYISELISNDKVKACHFHATKLFIDDLGTLIMEVYSMMFTKARHLSPWITTKSWTLWYPCHFLKLRYHCKKKSFYKLLDKRDAFSFFIVCMSYVYISIPKSILDAWR